MRCPKCSAEVPDGDYVCGACGAFARASAERAHADSIPEHPQFAQDPRVSHSPGSPEVLTRRAAVPPPTSPVRPPWGYPPGSQGPDQVYPPLHGWPGLAPPDVSAHGATTGPATPHSRLTHPAQLGPGEASAYLQQASIEDLLATRMQRAARRWARWSLVLAFLTLFVPVVFGPIGFASGYIAWRLGEKRLGRLGAALSATAMIAGIALAALLLGLGPEE